MSRHRRQPRSVSSCTNRPPLHCDSMSPSSLSLSRPACRASGRERVGRGWAPDATRPSTREVRLVRFRSDPPERESPCKPIDFSGDGLVPVTPQSDAATHRQQHRPHKSQLLRSVAACRGGSSRATRQPVRQRWLGARTPYGGTGYPSENVPNAVVVDDAVGCVAHDIEIELAS